MSAAIQQIINTDLATIKGAYYNEGFNFEKPPVIATTPPATVIPSADQTTSPIDQILINPNTQSDITVSAYFADECLLNTGYNVNDQPNFTLNTQGTQGKANLANAPNYRIYDSSGKLIQDWTQMAILSPTGRQVADQVFIGQTDQEIPLVMHIPAGALPVGEHLIVIHTYDNDLGYGGYYTKKGNDNGVDYYQGDPAYYYLDIQNPTCNLP